MSPRSHFVYLLAAAALFSAFANRTLAQSNVNAETRSTPAVDGQWSILTVSQIKPEARLQYEEVQKEITAAYKKAGLPWRYVLTTEMGNLNEYTTVSPLKNFSEMDGPSPLERALGKEGADSILAKIRPLTMATHRIAILSRDEMGIHTPGGPPRFVMLSHYAIAPGKTRDFDNWFKDEYLPVMRKGEVKNVWLSYAVFGGNPNEATIVRMLDKLGEFDAGPVARRVLGREGAQKLMDKMSGVVGSVHYEVLRFRPDLSYESMAGAPKAESTSR